MFRVILCLAALMLTTLFASSAQAARAIGIIPYQTQIKELHQIKQLLERADHDYKGHRAAAVKEITKAIHTLQPNLQHAKVAHPQGAMHPHGKGHEPQALSDAQLRTAIQGLATVSQQLHGTAGKNPRAGKAAADVQLAIKELTMALKIR